MKYFSELTNKVYDTMDACEEAEKAIIEQKNREKIKKEREVEARKTDATKVEEARKAFVEAQAAYREALHNFCTKYGSYHATYKSDDLPSLFDIFSLF